MSIESPASASPFLQRLRRPELTLSVELRPPRVDLGTVQSMDTWMAMHSTVRRLTARDIPLFITDGAVGANEEENLQHLVTNLDEELSRELLCPFLTTKHTLEYCHWYAARAVDAGCQALTILGGDKHVGPPRCVPHGYQLRQQLRERFPGLALGGWANPHRDPARQAGYLAEPEFTADFYLTQLVSHHDPGVVDQFLEAADKAGVDMPGVWGVFYYRSANKKTLKILSDFFEVPMEGLLQDFERGLSPAEICALSIAALVKRGVRNVYVSNLHPEKAPGQLRAIERALSRYLSSSDASTASA